jgi:SPP1 gp7 family putative phage head morphogenesis protein
VPKVKIRNVEEAARARLIKFAAKLRRFLRKAIREGSALSGKTIRPLLEKELRAIYKASFSTGLDDTKLPVDLQLDIISDVVRRAARSPVVTILQDKALIDAAIQTEILMNDVLQVVGEVQAEAVIIPAQMKLLDEKMVAKGISPFAPHRLETLARTSTNAFYNNAKFQAFTDPDVDDIIWGYEYTTVGDNRVRDEHAVLDGIKLPKDDPFWQRFWPPNGYNCRCTVLAIFIEDRDLQRPSSLSGIDLSQIAKEPEFQQAPTTFLAV